MEYEAIIGIEIHCELKTNSKMFSGSLSSYGKEANSCTNEIDLAFPGTLPCVNKEAVRKAVLACNALNLSIDPLVKFDRKNYYYSDLPKGYQITQQFHPIGRDGYINIDVDGNIKKIRINRIHMEEDTAKQFHLDDYSLIDFNRAGIPLIEIVSEPDMRNGKEAEAYVEALRKTLYYIGVSDVKMSEGSMRCDINISLHKPNEPYGNKCEIKNLNSIANISKAIEYEIERQKELLDKGEFVAQATRRFDEATRTTVEMRRKEGSVDYKFFPEPNIFPIRLDEKWLENIKNSLPELPYQKKERYKNDYNLKDIDIDIYINNPVLSSLFEDVMKYTSKAQAVTNWLMSDILEWMNNNENQKLLINPYELSVMIDCVDDKVISNNQAKEVVIKELLLGKKCKEVIEEKGLKQLSDTDSLLSIIKEVLNENEKAIVDYKNGKDRAVGFMVGQIMKKSRGQADPKLTTELLIEELKKY